MGGWDQKGSRKDWPGGGGERGVHSAGSGQGPVAGSCECGDEPSDSGATELVALLPLVQISDTLYQIAQLTCL
jgi:hypothetical protein